MPSSEQSGFRILDHTADVGLEARGADLAELFTNAARGMFSIITSLKAIRQSTEVPVAAQADNPDDLLLSWLSELLYISSTKTMIFSRFDISEIDDRHVVAKALGELIDQSLAQKTRVFVYHTQRNLRSPIGISESNAKKK